MKTEPGPWLPAPSPIVESVEFGWNLGFTGTFDVPTSELTEFGHEVPGTPRTHSLTLDPRELPGYLRASEAVDNSLGLRATGNIQHVTLSEYSPLPWTPEQWPEGAVGYELDGTPTISSAITVSGLIEASASGNNDNGTIAFDGLMAIADGWGRRGQFVTLPWPWWENLAAWQVVGRAHVAASASGTPAPSGPSPFSASVSADDLTVLGLLPSTLTGPTWPPLLPPPPYDHLVTYGAGCSLIEARATITRPAYRFLFEVPETKGMWRVRQKQSLPGTDSWPLRQRQNGGATGSWPLRQRQTGM